MRVRGRGKLIISLIIFLVMLTLSTSVVNADRGDGKIKGKTVGSTVVVSGEQNKEKDVFCVQHGTIIDKDTTYSVSGEYTVQDPVLAYILANGSLDASNDPLWWRDETQVALWMYLADSSISSYDKSEILKNISSDSVTPSTPNYSNAQKLLSNAKKYANNTKKLPTQYDVDIKTENATLNAEKGLVKFNVTTSNCDGFIVYYKKNTASTYTEYKNYTGSGSYDIEIPISKFNKGTYDFKVVAYRNIYEVKYKILKASGHQRLILVTNVAGEKKRVEATDYVLKQTRFDDLSLQKYIISVNGSAVSGRENKRTSEKETNLSRVKDNISTSKTVNSTSYYKDANAVEIEKDYKVTYRIEVYNNDTRSVNAIIKDKLPENCELYSVKKQGSASYSTSDFKRESGTTYRYELGAIPAGSSKYVDVTVTFKAGASINVNTAWISGEILNVSQYRTADRDYVRYKTPDIPDDPEDPGVPKKYAVALRKTVSAVNGKAVLRDKIVDDADKYDVNEDGAVNRRDPRAVLKKVAGLDIGETFNEEKAKVIAPPNNQVTAVDARIILQQIIRDNYPLYGGNDYKEQNPISVEVGDTVTYAIALVNTGNQEIIVKQITDTFDSSNLEYISGSVRGYGNPTATKSRWNFNN